MDKVQITYWVEGITEKGEITSTHDCEEIPLDAILAFGTTLQTQMIDQKLKELSEGFTVVIDEGITVNVLKERKDEDEEPDPLLSAVLKEDLDPSSDPSNEDNFEPRLKQITKWYSPW